MSSASWTSWALTVIAGRRSSPSPGRRARRAGGNPTRRWETVRPYTPILRRVLAASVRPPTAAAAPREPMAGTVEGVLAGRAGRQRMLRRPAGPTYEVIVDEVAVYRLTAPPEVVKKQLYHLATTVNSDPKATLRILPVRAVVEDFTVPRCTFSIYTYPDPGDPDVVAIDTVTSDLILTEPDQVTPYEKLYERLRDAALPPTDSLDLLTKAAAELPDQ